mgnify:CR=1 FL=1|jgi:hypothetical protein
MHEWSPPRAWRTKQICSSWKPIESYGRREAIDRFRTPSEVPLRARVTHIDRGRVHCDPRWAGKTGREKQQERGDELGTETPPRLGGQNRDEVRTVVTLLSLQGILPLLQNEFLADRAAPHLLDVVADGLEVRSRVVGSRDKDVVVRSRRRRRVDRRDRHEPAFSITDQVSGGPFCVWRSARKRGTHFS